MVIIQDEIIKSINILSINDNKFYINNILICDIYNGIEIFGFDKYYEIEMDKVYSFNWIKDENTEKVKLIINKE